MLALRWLLVLIVLWLVNQIHLPASFGVKGLNAMNVLVLVAVVLVMVQNRGLPPSRTKTPLQAPILLFFFALAYALVIGLLSDASAMSADFTVFKTGVFYISLYFLFYHGVRDVATIRLLVAAILFVSVVASLEAIREAIDYGLAAYSETKRAAGPFGTDYRASNLAAVYFSIFLPLFVAVAFYLRDRPLVRFGAMGGVALLVFAIFFTYSRQAYAIVAIIGLLMALRKNLGIALLLSLALWNYELWVPESAVERVQMTTQESSSDYGATEVEVDASTASRFELWQGGARMLAERPWGIGLNQWKRNIGDHSAYKNLDAHNFFVLISVEAGPIGMLAIGWLMFALFSLAFKQIRMASTAEAKTLAYGFMGATLALAMGNMYGSRFLNGEVIGNYWVLAALSARYMQLLRDGAMGMSQAAAAAAAEGQSLTSLRMPNGQRVRPETIQAMLDAEAADATPGASPSHAAARPEKLLRDQYGRLIRS